MAATNVLTTADTAATSSNSTVTVDTLFGLKGAATGARVIVESVDDAGAFNVIGSLTSEDPAKILAPGIYRFRRPAGIACGVYQGA